MHAIRYGQWSKCESFVASWVDLRQRRLSIAQPQCFNNDEMLREVRRNYCGCTVSSSFLFQTIYSHAACLVI